MISTELMSTLRSLSRVDKFQIVQALIAELAKPEIDLLAANQAYPVWSPYDATEAAETMLQVLQSAENPDKS